MGAGRKIAFTGIGIIVAIFAVAYLANRTSVLPKFVSGLGSIGSAIGQGVGRGVAALPAGVVRGAAEQGAAESRALGGTGQLGTTSWDIAIRNLLDNLTLGQYSKSVNQPPLESAQVPPNPLLPPAYGDTGGKDRDSIIARAREINRTIQRRQIPGGGIELSIPKGDGGILFRYKAAKRGLISTTITTSAGGTGPVVASQALINRLKTNLARAPRNINSR